MEITEHRSGDMLELRVTGRLDSYWADPLARRLEEVIREGAHHLRLNLAEVAYISSAGIRVLVKFYRQLRAIQGSFAITTPSEPVKTVLELAGLATLLISGVTPSAPASDTPERTRQIERANATFEIFDHVPGASLTCQTIGDPELLLGCRFGEEHCYNVLFPETTFAVGLGAFGHSFTDCRNRFGEFLAVAGAATYLPTDGTNVPDYLVATGTLVPAVEVLYCLACDGQFSHLVRFETKKEAPAVSLSELVETCLGIAGTDVAGMVIVAESAGLMGAALRRSPALQAEATTPFTHPQIREWLSFTAERAYSRSLTLAVGVATRADHQALAPLVRPLGKGPWPAGHFHAAAFSYRPLQKGALDVKTTVTTLFEAETLQGVLHLLNDDREIAGAGQSEFVRGACWIGPITEVVTEREAA
ncbi:MAG TPA: STAS domain-containing protein [Candidatus Binatia bacterium]|jgi:anti-anti-sigma factor|nr:STAS domain-containing protein [Candidatus Binatia bacterium]